ncbi:MAG: hypothetical protein LBH07_07915 [Treponema sp.]|jgi:hypothetical protein|nr:hypothetical protein [Treponema sp.]
MSIIEASYTVDKIIDDLLISMKEEQVEEVFTEHNITDKSVRIQLLRKCMQVLDTSDADSSLSPDDEYTDELAIFLNGTWRFLI